MAQIIMKLGMTYNIRVTSIRKTQKQVPSRQLGCLCRRWDITFTDKHGNVGEAETLTPNEEDPGFVMNAYQDVQCMFVSNINTYVIDPVDDYTGSRRAALQVLAEQKQQLATEQKQAMPTSNVIPDKNSAQQVINSMRSPAEQGPNVYSASLSGKAITFAMAYAKDLKVAEISNRPHGSKIEEQDLLDIIAWGGKLAASMSEMANF